MTTASRAMKTLTKTRYAAGLVLPWRLAIIVGVTHLTSSLYVTPQQEKKEYHSFLHLFKGVEQLSSLLHSPLKPKHEIKGKQFFEKKYGEVTGREMESIAESRGWFVPHGEAAESQLRYAQGCDNVCSARFPSGKPTLLCCRSAEERWAHVQNKLKEEFDEESSTPLDYMARGCEIPADVLDFTLFLQVCTGLAFYFAK